MMQDQSQDDHSERIIYFLRSCPPPEEQAHFPGPRGLMPGDECFLVSWGEPYGEGVLRAELRSIHLPLEVAGYTVLVKALLDNDGLMAVRTFMGEALLVEGSEYFFTTYGEAKAHFDRGSEQYWPERP